MKKKEIKIIKTKEEAIELFGQPRNTTETTEEDIIRYLLRDQLYVVRAYGDENDIHDI